MDVVKMADAERIMDDGYRVSFEWRRGMLLSLDYFPEHGEPLIPTEEDAWRVAEKFAATAPDNICNIYVINRDCRPVDGYEARMMRRYTAKVA